MNERTKLRKWSVALALFIILILPGCDRSGDAGRTGENVPGAGSPSDGPGSSGSAAPGETPPAGGSIDRSSPLRYRLASFDSRFGISKGLFLGIAGEAEGIWERAAGKELFTHDSTARFDLHLVFDERQQRTIDAKQVKGRIDARGRSYNHLVWQHDRKLERMTESQRRVETAAASFEKRLGEYNASVASWNERGGAPEDAFQRLERQKGELERQRALLDRMQDDLNADVEAVNEYVLQINELVEENSLDVTYYNGKFVESREFEQGQYSGTKITIYQFSETADLRVALAHEFGHALGFGHVADPSAIMHYRMGMQEMNRPALTKADRDLLASLQARR